MPRTTEFNLLKGFCLLFMAFTFLETEKGKPLLVTDENYHYRLEKETTLKTGKKKNRTIYQLPQVSMSNAPAASSNTASQIALK